MKRLLLVLLLVSCTTVPPAIQPAPGAASAIRGDVVAKDGSVLPGVTVTLDKSATTVTDANGTYAFPNVTPGRHSVTATLAGFGSMTRIVDVPAKRAVTVRCTINPSVSETITVTTEAPLADWRVDGVELEKVPTGRDPWTIMQNAPTTRLGNTPADYAPIIENGFNDAEKIPITTFSISVDGASYANVRRFLRRGQTPPADAVRVEEMINYFTYAYPEPSDGRPLSASTEVSGCPWATEHRLLRIGIRGKTVDAWKLAPNNLVFLLDVSGSMSPADRLPMIKEALSLLVDKLRGEDTVAIVAYAGNAGLVLPSTSGADKATIKAALARLESGGSTNGGQGIELAYKVAEENFRANANNRIILATDGDFNVGVANLDALTKLIESKRKRGIYLTCIGVGDDNLQDGKMEVFSKKGNGNYYYLDSMDEARKVFDTQLTGTLVAVADDVKVQLEFDPAQVAAYRQIGYEHRAMDNKDFADDTKIASDLGSGQSVTALFEVVPRRGASSGQIGTLRIRYKEPSAPKSQEIATAIRDDGKSAYEASADMQFAAAVAEFGMLLRDSKAKGTANWQDVAALARAQRGADVEGYRGELLEMIETSSRVVRVAAK